MREPGKTKAAGSGEALIEVRGLEVRYGDFGAVRKASFDIFEPGLVAIVGPSGCGKTSLLRAIAGFERPVAGSIRVRGREVFGPSAWVSPEKRRIGMVFQEGALFPHLTVEKNILYGLRRTKGASQRAQEMLQLVGLEEMGQRFPDQLSGGQQQRVALARALAPSPELVLLDEPFASLDQGLRERVREQVRGILDVAGATAILVTHDQEEAMSLADRLLVMEKGQVLQVGSPSEIYQNPNSAEVARFLGDGQLFACRVQAGRAQSALGSALTDAADGPGWLLVRPEDVTLLERQRGVSSRGQVGSLIGGQFFGHDRLDQVRLDSGETVAVRRLSPEGTVEGERVEIHLRDKRFTVFPDQLEDPP